MNKSSTNEKRKLFCYYYLKLGNVAEAAVKAGFESRTALVEGIKALEQSSCQQLIRKLYNASCSASALIIEAGLERLAFGNSNDAAFLAFSEELPSNSTLSNLDLFNVSEMKRVKGGGVEIKLFDRQKALERLFDYSNSVDVNNSATKLIHALQNSGDENGE